MSTPTAPPPGSTTTSSPAAGVFPASAIAIRTPPARGRAVPWTRLAWVTWRQHRTMLAGAAALLGALSLYLLIMGLKIHGAYAKVASCHPAASAHCQSLANAFRHAYYGGQSGSVVTSGLNAQTIPFLLLAVPVLLGVFAGAPLLAREFESGTVRFAWTQGCGRVRWTITKLVLLAAVLTAAAEAFSLLFSWYFHPFLADGQTGQFPMQPCLANAKVASHGRNRDAHNFGNLIGGHTAKILHLDDPALTLVDRSERLKSQIERDHVG